MISWEFSSMHSSHSCRRLGVTFFLPWRDIWQQDFGFFLPYDVLAIKLRHFFVPSMTCTLHTHHSSHTASKLGVTFFLPWHDICQPDFYLPIKLRQETFFCPLQACHIPIADCMQHFCHLATWHVPIISCEIGFARKKSDMACDLNI